MTWFKITGPVYVQAEEAAEAQLQVSQVFDLDAAKAGGFTFINLKTGPIVVKAGPVNEPDIFSVLEQDEEARG